MWAGRVPDSLPAMRSSLLLAALAAAAVAAPTAQAAPSSTLRDVTVKVSGSQKTTWSAVPVANAACNGKPSGEQGSGTETIEWSSSKVLKGQLSGSGQTWGLMFGTRSDIPISGTVKRTGGGHSVTCGVAAPDTSGACVGTKPFTETALLSFLTGRRTTIGPNKLLMTGDLFPQCTWVWDGMTVRTGAVLLNGVKGRFDPKRLAKRQSVTLSGRSEERCEKQLDPDPGVTCLTTTHWRVTLYPAKTKRR